VPPGSLIWLANEKIPIAMACRWADLDVSEGDGTRKTWCPFGAVSHSDGGVARALRMYEDENHAFCFACGRSWTPVSLMAEFWDCTRPEAAERMCVMAGITPPDWRERWKELQQPVPPDTVSLAEALKTYCARIYGPAWEIDQFEPRLAVPLVACFDVLPLVTTAAEADEWVCNCKLLMLSLLKEEGDDHQ
jgi:hypothetical protein